MSVKAETLLFYSYSSADEVLRGELEAHLALLKREHLIATWSFRDIDAGDEWKRSIGRNLETAGVILLLISASFMGSDYCWDTEMKRAIDRHDRGEAIVIPIILKPCDWHSAPFAKLQALPEGGKPVTSWRPRDKAWTNVVAGLRKRVESKRGVARAATRTKVESAAHKTESPIEKARRVAHAEQARRSRASRIQGEGIGAAQVETIRVFEEVERLVQQINESSPELRIRSGWRKDHCVTRIGKVTLNMFPQYMNPATESRLTTRLWFGGIVLPQDEGTQRYPEPPKQHRETRYLFDLEEDGTWCWRIKRDGEALNSTDLAERSINELLDLHEGVESGRIAFPEVGF